MRWPSRKNTLRILLALSTASAFLVGARWTDWLRHIPQPLVGLQAPVHRGAQLTVELMQPEDEPAELTQLRQENAELQRLIAHQQMLLIETERQLADVSGIRDQLPDAHLAIVIAPVTGWDPGPKQSYIRIMLSSDQGRLVAPGQWVMAGQALPRDANARDALGRQWLIGRISQVMTRSAIVQLTTDRGFPKLDVRFGRLDPTGEWSVSDEVCLCEGAGRNELRIQQATRDYFAAGHRLVVTKPPDLPVWLILAELTAAARTDSPQHFDLTAAPCAPLERLTHVYVLAAAQ
ncbi:MAG: hypothetical protein AB1716_02015 [Planctomycetota bacterium]